MFKSSAHVNTRNGQFVQIYGNLWLPSKTIYCIQQCPTMLHVSVDTTIFKHWLKHVALTAINYCIWRWIQITVIYYKYGGINSIKIARAGQAYVNNKYNNFKHMVLNCWNAMLIYFKNQCLNMNLILNYANIKIKEFIYAWKFSYRPTHIAILSRAEYNKLSLVVNINYHRFIISTTG